MKLIRALAVSLLVLPTGALTQDYENGVEAYKAEDFETAFQELQPIAEEGFPGAQVHLGLMYMAGQGVPQDELEAIKWFTLAAKQNDALAQLMLGLIYANSETVERDEAAAIHWFRLSAGQSIPLAQAILGARYETGEGVPQDYAEAIRLYRLAAMKGETGGQSGLARAYKEGIGVAQDYVTAHMWYNIASANGHEKSSKRRDDLAARMTPADISEAQRRARVCMASNYKDCD